MAGTETATRAATLSPRRIVFIAALALAVLVAFFAVQNLASSAVYYLTPTEAAGKRLQPGQPARIGGLVLAGTLQYDPQRRLLVFSLSDGTTNVAVVGDGAPPALLREGAGAVVEGTFAQDGTFHATAVIAKHDEQYAPPPPGQTPPHNTP